MSLSDRDAIARIKNGEIDYFKVIVEKYTRTILGFFMRRVSVKEDAEDLAQNCFLKFYRKLEVLDLDKEVSPYLIQIAKNELKMFYRKRKPSLRLDEGITVSKEEANVNEDFDVLDRLPKKEKKILKLLSEGFSYREIAKRMDKPLGTIKTIIRRTRLKIKRNQ